jgi:choline transporter-like protein 2/4/5
MLIFFRTRIKIAIELIEEASIAVGDMMSTLFFPIIPFALVRLKDLIADLLK